jgi:hypothetical protein
VRSIIGVKSTNYEAPHYAVVSSLQSHTWNCGFI